MTDGSETRYTPAIHAEIERRWQDLEVPVHWMAPLTAWGIIRDIGTDPYSHLADGWCSWLETMIHAQEDIQILLEGVATAERSLLAATARIAEVEGLRREDATRYTDMIKRVGEANLELRGMLEEERKEWREWDQIAQMEIKDLEERLAMGQQHEQDEALSREAELERYTAAVQRVCDEMLDARRIIEEERKEAQVEAGRYAEAMHDTLAERDLARGLAQRRKVVLERLLMLGLIPEGELLRAVREEVG